MEYFDKIREFFAEVSDSAVFCNVCQTLVNLIKRVTW